MKVLFDHQLVCHRDENGSFVACGPAIAGCHAVGPTSELARQERHNVFAMNAEEFAARLLTSPAILNRRIAAKAMPLTRTT